MKGGIGFVKVVVGNFWCDVMRDMDIDIMVEEVNFVVVWDVNLVLMYFFYFYVELLLSWISNLKI